MMQERYAPMVAEIDRYLAATGISPSYFGEIVCGNVRIINRLRDGGRIFEETRERILAFLADPASWEKRGYPRPKKPRRRMEKANGE